MAKMRRETPVVQFQDRNVIVEAKFGGETVLKTNLSFLVVHALVYMPIRVSRRKALSDLKIYANGVEQIPPPEEEGWILPPPKEEEET